MLALAFLARLDRHRRQTTFCPSLGTARRPRAGTLPVIDRPDDAHLVSAAQAGDRQALEKLLRLHYDRLYAVCRRLTGNDADAADAAQETMIALVRNLHRFDGRSLFSTWAYRVAVNASLDELRRRRRRPEPRAVGGDVTGGGERSGQRSSDEVGGPAGKIASFESDVDNRLEIDAALCLVPDDFRAAVVLRDLCTLDYAEIGEVLGIPVGTVRSRISRGRALLATLLVAAGETGPTGGNPPPSPQRPTSQP